MNDIPWGTLAGILIAAITAAGGWIVARSGGRASPYDSLADRVVSLESSRVEDRAQIESLQTANASLERRLDAVIADRDDVVAYLVAFREWVALGAPPPAPRVPLHLRNVIPDWTADDADRSTDVQRGPNGGGEPVGP